jgi:Fe-S cluster biogenesis protein NfuA
MRRLSVARKREKAVVAGKREKEIEAVLNQSVRPVLNAHGGAIELAEIEGKGIVHLRLLGACATCMSAQQTISDIVVASIRESCPWVADVRVEAGISDELLREALGFLKKRRESR